MSFVKSKYNGDYNENKCVYQMFKQFVEFATLDVPIQFHAHFSDAIIGLQFATTIYV